MVNYKTKRINLFAGPGAGKTTIASGLFYEMKKKNFSVEITHEFAKELTYLENYLSLGNQLLVSGEQIRRNELLEGKVEFIINDSPTILGAVYLEKNQKEFEKILVDRFTEYDNINIFLNRNSIKYEENGRMQTYEESLKIDEKILGLLKRNKICYYMLDNDENIIQNILDLIKV